MKIPSRLAAGCLSAILIAVAGAHAQGPGRPPPLPYLLRLQPDQHAAWRAYEEELALERADAAEAAQDATQLNAMTTPQRIDAQLAQLPRQEARMRRQAQAVRAFYAQLSPEQRRVFDRVTRAPLPPSPADTGGAMPGSAGSRRAQLPQPPADAPLPIPGG